MKPSATVYIPALLAALTLLGPSPAPAQTVIPTPATRGDQLLFVYDATAGRVPFLVVSNLAAEPITVQLAWYAQGADRRLAVQTQVLPAGSNGIFDPSQVEGVEGSAGLAVVTPVAGTSDPTPVVPPSAVNGPSGPLYGGFTLADVATGTGFGQNPLARLAVDRGGRRASAGSIVDGSEVFYQQIAPDQLVAPFYFDPSSDGLVDRVILAGFADVYGPAGFAIEAGGVNWSYRLIDADGTTAFQSPGVLSVAGVHFDDVQSLAGDTPLSSSGKLILENSAPSVPVGVNVFGLMSQSLDTFAVGQRMPGVFRSPPPGSVLLDQENRLDGDAVPYFIGRVSNPDLTPDPSGMSDDQQVGQTFTVGRTGRLQAIRVPVRESESGTPTEAVTLELRRADGTAPGADDRDILASVSVSARPGFLVGVRNEEPATWVSFDVSGARVDVRAGDELAFSVKTNGTVPYLPSFSTDDAYTGGRLATRNRASGSEWSVSEGSDLGFQTFVRIP